MAKQIVVQVENEQIIFYSDFIYADLNKTVRPRKWDSEFPAGPGRTKNGAWLYPLTKEAAAGLMRAFNHIFEREKPVLAPEFVSLAAASKSSQAMKIDIKTVVTSMSKRCAIASAFIRVRSPYDAEMVKVFKSVPNAQFVKDPEPAWMYPADVSHAARLYETLNLYAGVELAEAEIDKEFLDMLPDPDADRLPIRSKRTPRKHQERTYWRAYYEPAFHLGYDMGAGKTKVAIDLCVNRDERRVLVVCPKAVIDVWPKELLKDADESYNPMVLKLDGAETVIEKARKMEEFIDEARTADRPAFVILNYDIVYREPLDDTILSLDFDCVIADESHKIKSPGGKASMFLARLARRVKHRLALSGTPMPNDPGEIYAQYRFLDWTIFGPRFKGYQDPRTGEYKPGFCDDFVARFDNYGNPVQWKNLRLLNAKIYRIMDRVKTTDVIDLPPVEHIEYYFDLSAKARKIYKDLDKKFAAQVSEIGPISYDVDEETGQYEDAKIISVKQVVTQLLRFAQLTGGYAKLDDGTTVQVDEGKRELLKELLDGLDPAEPAVVFCRFHEDLETVSDVCRELDRGSLELSGRRNELASWQDGGAPVLAVQIQSGGAGVDCTRAAHVFYYSVGYSNGDYEQSLKRADRPGQTRPVRFYHLLANDSVDIDIQKALVAKTNVVESVLAMKTNRLEAGE